MTKTSDFFVSFRYLKGRKTECTICNKDKSICVTAQVKRCLEDSPCKLKARRFAFRKTMAVIVASNSIPRKTRTKIWAEFNSKVNQPKEFASAAAKPVKKA